MEHTDPYLTEIGLEQAEYLAKYLKEKQHITNDKVWNIQNQYGFGFTHIYTSLMERAVMTAAPTVRVLGDIPFTAWTEIQRKEDVCPREDADKKGIRADARF
jgi:broad specificity phosphatase PhoE